MELNLHHKLVLVTGSTSGIGKEIAKEFLCEKARVIINGRNRTRVEDTVKELSQYGEVWGIAADLSDPEGQREVVNFVQSIGRIEILVNNAGLCSGRDFFELDSKEIEQTFQLNVFSMLKLTQAFLPIMMEADFGRIINISSDAAIKPYPHLIHYSMTKAAVLNFTKGIAELAAGYNITVNSVMPGPTLTNELKDRLDQAAIEKSQSAEELAAALFKKHNPASVIQRFIQAEEVAGAVLYLASKKAAAITGSAIRVEGGILSAI